MSRIVRALPLAALGVALSVLPAQAVEQCVEGSYPDHVCVEALDGNRYACVSGAADPSRQTVDDVIVGFVCLEDIGAGPQFYHCFRIGRTSYMCSR